MNLQDTVSHVLSCSSYHYCAQVLPLTRPLFFHLLVVGGIFFWTGVHLITHFCSFALDRTSETVNLSNHEVFKSNIIMNLNPTITGFLVIAFLSFMLVTSISPIQKLCKFIGFHVIHWSAMIFIYLLLIIHGPNHYNPSFWKWLIPAAVIFIFERFYQFVVVKRYSVKVVTATPYDELTRVGKLEVVKPRNFHFTPGQYVLVNIPEIGAS